MFPSRVIGARIINLHFKNRPYWVAYLLVGLSVNPTSFGASLIAQLVKKLPAMQETPVRFLGQEDPLDPRHESEK